PLAVPLEESYAERMLQFRDRSRNGGLSDVEALRRLAHAAGLHDGHKDVQVLQFHPSSDAIAQLHGNAYVLLLSCDQTIALFTYRSIGYLLWPGPAKQQANHDRAFRKSATGGAHHEISQPKAISPLDCGRCSASGGIADRDGASLSDAGNQHDRAVSRWWEHRHHGTRAAE